MSETLSNVLQVVTILGVLLLAYKNYRDGKASGLTVKHKSSELNLSAYEKINAAQAQALAAAEIKIEKFEKRLEKLEAANDLLQRRDEVHERRELALAGTLTIKGWAIPPLPDLPTE